VAAGALGGAVSIGTGGGYVSAGAIGASAGLLVGGVFLLGAGAVRITNNIQVSNELERRHTILPLALKRDEQPVVAFFPIAPLPSSIRLDYREGDTEKRLEIDARKVLAIAHVIPEAQLVARAEPRFPGEASRRRLEKGHVRAMLYLDARGDVGRVQVLDSSSPIFEVEAKNTFRAFRYTPGPDGRAVEHTMHFRRSTGAP
jgi:hypothetical protein